VFEALEEDAATRLSTVPVDLAIDRSKVLRVGYVLLAIVTLCCLYAVLAPKNPLVSAARVLMPWADILPPSRVEITEIKPGHAVGEKSIVRGERLVVSAEIKGLADDEPATLFYSTSDGQAVDRPIAMYVPPGGLKYECQVPDSEGGVYTDLAYHIEAGDARSRTYQVEVVAAPTIGVDRIEYDYPEYTGYPERIVVREGDIDAIEGTRVSIFARANHPIDEAWIDFGNDGTRDRAMEVDGSQAIVQFELELEDDRRTPKHERYSLRFVNVDGRKNRDPIEYAIRVTPDEAPQISIVNPEEKQVQLPLNGMLVIETQAVDHDFALSAVELIGKVAGRTVLEEKLLDEEREAPFMGRYEFVPQRLKLKVGDRLEYWALARDNKAPRANESRTESYEIEIVSPDNSRPNPDQLAQNDRRPNPPNQPQDQQPEQKRGERPQQDQPQQDQPQQDQPMEKKSAEEAGGQQEKQQPQEGGSEGGQQQDGGQGEGQEGQSGKSQGGQQPAGDQKQQPRDRQDQASGEPQQGEQGQGEGEPQQKPGEQQGAPGEGAQPGDGGQRGASQPGSEQQPGSEPRDDVATDGSDDGTAVRRLAEHLEKKQKQKPAEPSPQEGAKQPQDPNSGKQQQPGSKQPDGGQKQPSPGAGEPGAQRPQQQPDASPGAGEKPQPSPEQGDPNGTGARQPGKEKPAGNEQGSQPGAEKQPMPGEKKAPPEHSPGAGQGEREKPGQETGEDPLGQGEQKPQPDAGQPGAGEQPGEKPRPQQGGDQGQGQQQGPKEGAGAKSKPGQQPGEKPQAGPGERPQAGGGDPQNDKGAAGSGRQGQDDAGSPQPQTDIEQNKFKQDRGPGEKQPGEKKPQSPAHGKKESNSDGSQGGDKPGGGEEGGGQKANRRGTGSAGQNTAADEGGGRAEEAGGAGETSDQAGDDQKSDQSTGKPGAKEKGPGSGQGQPGGGDLDLQHEKPTDSSQGERQPGKTPPGKPGDGNQDPREGEGSRENGGPASGIPRGGSESSRVVDSGSREAAPGDEANLEYARKKTDLVLDYLEDQLGKDAVDPELEKLIPNWDQGDYQRLYKDLSQMKRQAQQPGAEGQAAKRRLDETLRNFGLRKERVTRRGTERNDTIRGLRESRRAPVPSEYAEQLKAYKRGLSTSQGSGSGSSED